MLSDAGSIAGVNDWQVIVPDRHHDWIGQRDETYDALCPMGSKAAKAGTTDNAIFRLFSNGYKTSRDAYLYNFSRDACAHNGRRVIDEYLSALRQWNAPNSSDADLDAIVDHHSSGVRWDRELKNNLRRRKATSYSENNIWVMPYRPYVIKQHCYVDYTLVNNKYQMDKIFPSPDIDNRAICVPGIGSTKPFSAHSWWTRCLTSISSRSVNVFRAIAMQTHTTNSETGPFRRFSCHLIASTISPIPRSPLFVRTAPTTRSPRTPSYDYVYGVLHAPDFRERFATTFSKELAAHSHGT